MDGKLEPQIKPKSHGGKRPGSGRKKGVPNKINADLKSMIIGALSKAGGERYLLKQATANPNAFLTLIGKVLPMQVTGKDGDDLEIKIIQRIIIKADE